MDRTCKVCNTVRPLDEFVKDSKRPDGRRNVCKPCKRAADRGLKSRGKSTYLADDIAEESMRIAWEREQQARAERRAFLARMGDPEIIQAANRQAILELIDRHQVEFMALCYKAKERIAGSTTTKTLEEVFNVH